MVISKQYAQANTETFYSNKQTEMAFKTVVITLVPTQQNLSTQHNPICWLGFHKLIKWVKKNILAFVWNSLILLKLKFFY